MRKVLLISNTVMHYRVSLYNYFYQRFKESGWEFKVLTNELQAETRIPFAFHVQKLPFKFELYKRTIVKEKPDAVILFLHLKDKIFWPIIHWLKWNRIPFTFWTKTRNLDNSNPLRNCLFSYVLWLSDSLILYSGDLIKNVPKRERHKAFPANNTINFADFPKIAETKDEIKQKFGIPFERVVLFAGRMDVDGGRKKVDHLIDLFRDVGSRNFGLVIVGSGMKQEWKDRINPKTTVYLGEIHDPENLQISRIFTMADVCVIPGHVGLAVNQAFYFGLPVVTEEGKHPPEIAYLKPGRNGFIVPQNDLGQLKEKIIYLLENNSVREEFSLAARADILREASTEGMFQGFLKSVEYLTTHK